MCPPLFGFAPCCIYPPASVDIVRGGEYLYGHKTHSAEVKATLFDDLERALPYPLMLKPLRAADYFEVIADYSPRPAPPCPSPPRPVPSRPA